MAMHTVTQLLLPLPLVVNDGQHMMTVVLMANRVIIAMVAFMADRMVSTIRDRPDENQGHHNHPDGQIIQ